MYCTKCGQQVSNQASFCYNCGTHLTPPPCSNPPQDPDFAAQSSTQQQNSQNFYQAPPQNHGNAQQARPNDTIRPPIISILKTAGRSGCFLTAIILLCVSVFLNLLGIGNTTFLGAFRGSELTLISHISSMSGIILSVLIVIGLTMTFDTANDPYAGFKTTGLSIIRVIAWIYFGLYCAAGAALLVLALWGLEFIILLLIAGPLLALMILVQLKTVQTINDVIRSVRTLTPQRNASLFLAVMCFIIGGINAILGFLSIATLYASGLISVLSSLCSAAAYICLGTTIIFYRSLWSNLQQRQYFNTNQYYTGQYQ